MAASREKVLAEAKMLEEAAWLEAESHITAAGFWSTFQIFWGSTAAILAAVASGSAFADQSILAGALAIAATASAAVMTSLQPSTRTSEHLASAGEYNGVQYGAHLLRELESESLSDGELETRFDELAAKHGDLNRASPHVPRRLSARSADYIRSGQPYFRTFGLAVPPDLARVPRPLWRRLLTRRSRRPA